MVHFGHLIWVETVLHHFETGFCSYSDQYKLVISVSENYILTGILIFVILVTSGMI
jgi:hypothetical protein